MIRVDENYVRGHRFERFLINRFDGSLRTDRHKDRRHYFAMIGYYFSGSGIAVAQRFLYLKKWCAHLALLFKCSKKRNEKLSIYFEKVRENDAPSVSATQSKISQLLP